MPIFLWIAVVWAALIFGIAAKSDSGTALRFNGLNSVVSISNNASLNAYPLTVSTWFRCQTGTLNQQVLVSKYFNTNYNGWALTIYNGFLRGFYYANGSGNKAIDTYSVPTVTDGTWHHAALVVDSGGGRLYLDGNMIATNSWSGTKGAVTTTAPVTLGNLADLTIPLSGDLDEVTLWNRALTANELNYLKHRQLSGSEDGLVGYWKLNDAANLTTVDSTTHGNTGVLVNSPAWVTSGAPVPLSAIATNCLKFAGTGDYVSVQDAPDLDAFPFTTTAWVKTSRNSAQADGILCKYGDGLFNGYAVFLLGGHVHAWYFKDSLANSVYGSGEGFDGGFIADNDWHHIAFTVDELGGNLYVDGKLAQHMGWSGSSGAPSTTLNFQIGKYYNYPNSFQGQMDEVTLWNRALASNEVQTLKNLPLVGNETGLVGYWRLDDGTGPYASDSTANAHTASLVNNPSLTGSTAFLGDGQTYLSTSADYAANNRNFAITGSPSQSAFPYGVSATLTRLYDYGTPPPAETVSGLLDYSLQTIPGGLTIPLTSSEVSFGGLIGSHLASSPVQYGAANGRLNFSTNLPVLPNGVQLDSVDYFHQLIVTLSHSENGGAYAQDQTTVSASTQLLHFDGNLFAGTFLAAFSSLDSVSTPSNILAGDHLDCGIAVSAGKGGIPGFPAYTFGNGSLVSVSLLTNGDARLKSGTIVITPPSNDLDSVSNISFQHLGITLSTNGAASSISLILPTGLGVSLSGTAVRVMTNQLLFTTYLDASLHPATNVLTYPGLLYLSAETLPCWIAASALNWNVNAGQIALPTSYVSFVRQNEDDQLLSLQSFLSDPNAARRISNDAYFRNAGKGGPTPDFVVTADSNGVAQLTGSMVLQPPDFRPHFPYTDAQPGNQLPVGTGMLLLSNSLVDGSSYLSLNSPAPLYYARDCADTNCSGSAVAPAAVTFTSSIGQFSFTPDGGLLGYGTAANSGAVDPGVQLAWGSAGGSLFAQQTSPMVNTVFNMAGTFLRGDQTSLDGSEKPAVILFTGWGDDTDPTIMERPGSPEYNTNGFANYAGLNFRAPAQGESYIANTDTGLYPLTSRCKYYVRSGGVSGIQEAASFPTNFSLYGYGFSFSSYRLSYLDGINWESRTDGLIAFPDQPAGFNLEFQRMKFVCSGGLDTAQLPQSIGPKHLKYWNVDFQPQSIDFKPQASEQCSSANRFLAVGSQVTVPFIIQPLYGSLGFWPSGNLVTVADGIVGGVDSRFQVPGNLSLKGSGSSTFPITTASDGYFNNWNNPNRPANGFFNLAGKVRVPFFTDMKVHLHITPNTDAPPEVDVMGGWPLVAGGADHGWEEKTNNFFNTGKFDTNAWGWPQSLASVDSYRNSQVEQYHPRAQRNWHNVVFFDYPAKYNSVLRHFEGFSKAPVTLPIVDVDSNLKSLTTATVDLDFSQDLNFKLPQIKGLSFISDANGEINGPFNTISNAIYGELKDISDKTGLSRGFQSLGKILRDDGTDFFSPILGPSLDTVASNIVTSLRNGQTTNPASVLTNVYATIASANAGLEKVLSKINGTANDINSVLGQVNTTYTNVDDTLGLLDRMLEKDSEGNRHILRIIVEKLIQDQSGSLGLPGALADNLDGSVVDAALTEVESSVQEIQTEIKELRQELEDGHTEFADASGGITQALDAVTNNAAEIQNFLQLSQQNVSNFLSTVVSPTGDYFSADPAAAKAKIKQKLIESFLGSSLESDYQKKFKQFFSDDNFVLDELLTVLTDKINSAVRSTVENYISGGGTGQIYQVMKGIGQMQQSMFTAKVTGQPVFNKDSLRSIHLDALIKLNLPNEMRFPVYMEVREVDSQSANLACIPGGDSAQEVILGAKNVPLKWPGSQSNPDLNLTANARWTLKNGSVVGIGGLFEVEGNASFEGCTIKTIGATFAIGATENYFAAKADATALIGPIPVEFKAGIFGGHACSLDPLIYIDPNCTNILNNAAGFTGVYIQYGGGVSLSKILFGTSSCALDVEANISNSEFIQGTPDSLSLGLMQKTDLEISLFCLISGQASFTEAGIASISTSGVSLTLLGSAQFCGSAGPCPFCVQGCKTFTVKGVLKQNGIDYSVDY